MGYDKSLIEILLREENKLHYSTISKWHNEFFNPFSHEQLVTITMEGGEYAFLFLKQNISILHKYNLNADEMMLLVLQANQASAQERLKEHLYYMDNLIQYGFNKQQFFQLYDSDYSNPNLRQITDKFFQFQPAEITQLITQCPAEIFIIFNQYLEYFIQLTFQAEHLIQLVNKDDYAKIPWILNNYDWLISCDTVNPDILCNEEIASLELHRSRTLNTEENLIISDDAVNPELLGDNDNTSIDLNRLRSFDIEDNLPEHINRLILTYISDLKIWGFTNDEVVILAKNFAAKINIPICLKYFPILSQFGYSQEQIKQLGMFKTKLVNRFETIIITTPILLKCGFQLEEIFNFATAHSYVLNTAAEYSDQLISQGFTISDLIFLFSRKSGHQQIIESLLKHSPQLIIYGLTQLQILKIACYSNGEALPLLAEYYPEMLNIMKKNQPDLSADKVTTNLVKKLLKFNCLAFINLIINEITKENNSFVFSNLQKSKVFYYPKLHSYFFIYPREIKSIKCTVTGINSCLKSMGYKKMARHVSERFAILLDENLWSKLWPNNPAPTDEITEEDLYDYSLERDRYYRVNDNDISAYIFCNTSNRALICSNHLNYLNMEVQKSDEGIDEPIPQFKTRAIDNYVLIENYGDYIEALIYLHPNRYEHIPDNIFQLQLLEIEEDLSLFGPEEIIAQESEENLFLNAEPPTMIKEKNYAGNYSFFSQDKDEKKLRSDNLLIIQDPSFNKFM